MPSPGRVKSSHRITAAIEDVAACQAGTRGRSVLLRALHRRAGGAARGPAWNRGQSQSILGATEKHFHTPAAPDPCPSGFFRPQP